MSENNYKDTKDKVVESVKESAGKLNEVDNDSDDEAKVVTDKLVGSGEQTFDKFSDEKNVDSESKLKKGAEKSRDPLTKEGEPVTDRLTGNPDKKHND